MAMTPFACACVVSGLEPFPYEPDEHADEDSIEIARSGLLVARRDDAVNATL